jgi:glycerol-3-phosphate cytidylyltransferase-like family protein
MSKLDTRSKLISPDQVTALAARLKSQSARIAVVTGYFDPLLPAHARALAGVRSDTACTTLVVVLLPSLDALLSAQARAELAAALSMVDYVIIASDGHVGELVERLGTDILIPREALDVSERRQLIEHVQRRHGESFSG